MKVYNIVNIWRDRSSSVFSGVHVSTLFSLLMSWARLLSQTWLNLLVGIGEANSHLVLANWARVVILDGVSPKPSSVGDELPVLFLGSTGSPGLWWSLLQLRDQFTSSASRRCKRVFIGNNLSFNHPGVYLLPSLPLNNHLGIPHRPSDSAWFLHVILILGRQHDLAHVDYRNSISHNSC